jgi:enhancing lycopene biosynthesis protein 2
MKKVAVILCGSGYRDGSEIREAVATLWALSQEHAKVQCFAPDSFQHDVVNCLTGAAVPTEKRNMLVEAARIARGEVEPLTELKVENFDALLIPGGFGAAKNLCDFAFKGSQGQVIPEMEKVITGFFTTKKPIGAICIAPAIVAIALRKKGLLLTVGEQGETSQELEKLGHRHQVTKVTDCCIDSTNKVVTTGAYMFGQAALHDVFSGIQKCVKEVLRIA